MATIGQQIKRLEKLNQRVILNQVFKALKRAQGEIIKANKLQLVKGENISGNIVGRYSKHTQGYATADGIPTLKKFDEPYNFTWFNDFFNGFDLKVENDTATIFSTGIGSGGKKEFLTTNNLMGLNDENLKKVIRTEILPFIQKFARQIMHL